MNYKDQLQRHISFIKRSCSFYDQGDKEEALRIAVSLRVLFHDTSKSTSLLKHLENKENVRILSTFGVKNPDPLKWKSVPVISIPFLIDVSKHSIGPLLDRSRSIDFINIDAWWSEVVMICGESYSRNDIILSAANQDGGAHVDSNPNYKTTQLKDGVLKFDATINGVKQTIPLVDSHFPLLRQFGYEILNSPEIMQLL
jgi:hypothetical protein